MLLTLVAALDSQELTVPSGFPHFLVGVAIVIAVVEEQAMCGSQHCTLQIPSFHLCSGLAVTSFDSQSLFHLAV